MFSNSFRLHYLQINLMVLLHASHKVDNYTHFIFFSMFYFVMQQLDGKMHILLRKFHTEIHTKQIATKLQLVVIGIMIFFFMDFIQLDCFSACVTVLCQLGKYQVVVLMLHTADKCMRFISLCLSVYNPQTILQYYIYV